MNQNKDQTPEEVVQKVASNLGLEVSEIYRALGVGELSWQCLNGSWTIPDWSADYFNKHRSGTFRETPSSRSDARETVPRPPAQQHRKKNRRRDPEKIWKRKVNELAQSKNKIIKEIKKSQIALGGQDREHISRLESERDKKLEDLEALRREGVQRGFNLDNFPKTQARPKREKTKQAQGSPKPIEQQVGIFTYRETNSYWPGKW